MPLFLNSSNNLGELAAKLAADMQSQGASVFQPYYIVTQTEGMNNWLKLQIAEHSGIAANCIFLKPNDIVYQIYNTLDGHYPNMLSSSNLTWLLYKILGEKDFNDRYRHIADYYAADNFDKDIRRLALAEKMTDLFDQYQVYRPDMIKEWNSLSTGDVSKDDWQQYLWNKARELSGDKLHDKTVLREHIVKALNNENNTASLRAAMPAVYVFGLSVATAYHLNVFNIISEVINVNYYLLNPAPSYYWFDDKSEKQQAAFTKNGWIDKSAGSSGNPLLTNWGRIIGDTFSLLFQNEELLNAYEETGVIEPTTDTLLHKIQHDIFKNATKEERNTIIKSDIADSSVIVNACYTIAREVEVLYNYLVHLIDKRKEALSPRDIVVMVTNIDDYAPYIKAIFSNAPHHFRYIIADENFSIGDTMINALKSLLSINHYNFGAEDVLQLLDSGFIRKRFAIANLPLIRQAVDTANIRFGMEGRTHDDTRYISWAYGLNRIIYGLCMSGGDEYNIGDETLYPLDIAEGSDSFELVRFAHFAQVLMSFINERRYDRTIAEWVEYIERVIQNLVYDSEDDTEEEYNIILSHLEKMNVANDFVKEKISYDVFSQSFLQAVTSTVRNGSYAGGGITFCSLIPMRSIPFKVVCLLGLNFDKFPRREVQTGFNLMEKKRMKGDRNVKDNDKHLFLETILSARQYLYMSYVGQSAKDNTVLPPSALLDELIDYIENGCNEWESVRQTLITMHPLHSFSRKYSRDNDTFYSYLNDKKCTGNFKVNNEKKAKEFTFDEITINQLTGFFRHPFKVYYNKVLSIYYEENDLLLSDTELFDLDNLQQWSLKQDMLHLEAGQLEALKDKLIKTGDLPLKHMADIVLTRIEEDVKKVRILFKDCTDGNIQSKLQISVNINGDLITGTLSNLYGNKLVYISYSKNEYKNMLDAYISYLAAKAQGNDVTVCFISATLQQTYIGENITKSGALQRLNDLMELYKKGHESILMFHPVFKIEPGKVATLEVENFKKILRDVFHSYNYPCTDRYLLNEYANKFFDGEEAHLRFKESCNQLIAPLAEFFPAYFN